jgi:hypothetical protein
LITIKKFNRSKWLLGLLFVVAILLAACSADTSALQPDAAQPEETGTPSQEPENQPQEEENQPQEEASQPDLQPEENEAKPPPEFELGFERGSLQLEATDPGSFVLAAGEPQLVELFAFW